jgi:hypothetical protein
VEWYDELLLLTASPVVRLNRAVALGEADGPRAGLAALAELDPELPRHPAVRAYLLERAGDLEQAAALYAEASRSATNVPERDHLTREAARVRELLRSWARLPQSHTRPPRWQSRAEDWTSRELRHSFVSLLSSAGIPIEDIANLVGHANTRTTEKVYRKELRPVLRRGAKAMDDIFRAHQKPASPALCPRV